MKKYLIAGIIAFLSLAGFVGYDYALRTDKLSLGGTCTRFVGALPTTLSGAGITTSATSIGVSSATIKQTGQKLNMQHFTCDGGSGLAYLTLEPGNTSRQEFVSCSGITQNSNGTAIFTGCSRGLEPVYPYTASSTFQFTHGGGTTVIVSNSPPFYDTFVNKSNDATITGVQTFASTSLPGVAINTTDAQLVANGTSTLATVNYVNNVSIAGASNATEAVKGIVELGTALETASSTIFGSTGASVVMQSKNATDTPLSGCASGYTTTPGAGCSVIATLAGKIRQTWLDIFTTANTWTNTNLFSSPTSFSSTTNFTATATFSAGVIGVVDYWTATASSSWTKPNGVSTSSMMMIELWGAGGGGGAGNEGGGNSGDGGGGGGGAYVRRYMLTSSATSTVFCRVGSGGASATAGENTVFGTYATAYGGGAGGSDAAAASSAGGGGGGGSASAGSVGGAGGVGTGGAGGNTNGGAQASSGAAGNSGNSGSGGGAGFTGGQGYEGGGGGGSNNTNGGSSTWGGGGGAGGGDSAFSGGTSVFGGAGGDRSATEGNGGNGNAPGGGGAGAHADWDGGVTAYTGGIGARGECRITTWK